MLPGRISGWKGHRLLIDALAILKARGRQQLRCLMVGAAAAPGTAASLEAHADNMGVGGWVHIAQDCNDLPAAYMVSDVVVSASTRPEAFGRIVAEGQAMGRPVIAPAHGAAQEIIEAGVTGWLFTPGDPVSLADGIERALKLSREERERIAERAIARVRAKFDKADMCAKTIAVYDEVLARRTARP
jgi:glycosyltransferase involved in cell wall biosynthesis